MTSSTSSRPVSDLDTYYREISRVPLLTPLEERQLAWQVINDNCESSRRRMIQALPLVASVEALQVRQRQPPHTLTKSRPFVCE